MVHWRQQRHCMTSDTGTTTNPITSFRRKNVWQNSNCFSQKNLFCCFKLFQAHRQTTGMTRLTLARAADELKTLQSTTSSGAERRQCRLAEWEPARRSSKTVAATTTDARRLRRTKKRANFYQKAPKYLRRELTSKDDEKPVPSP